jgi:D-3-phosphoglycerate dehydrogenase
MTRLEQVMPKVLITTVPFGDINARPLALLEELGVQYLINPLNKKLTENELAEMVSDFDIIIAGTEPITSKVMDAAPNLKLISRVGVGLDSVDLVAAREREILVSYTPDAPAPAVAELTLALMLNQLRLIHVSNSELYSGRWNRFFGRRLEEVTIGIIGLGRIGKRVLGHIKGFGDPRILVNDIVQNLDLGDASNVEWVSKEEIYQNADLISLHLPLTNITKNMIRKEHLLSMKKNAIIINTSRGGIINEIDLSNVLKAGHLSGAAVDVFEREPYFGPLTENPKCLLTAHMGSMSIDCRTKMEIEATEEAARYLTGKPLSGIVPEDEYKVQQQGL